MPKWQGLGAGQHGGAVATGAGCASPRARGPVGQQTQPLRLQLSRLAETGLLPPTSRTRPALRGRVLSPAESWGQFLLLGASAPNLTLALCLQPNPPLPGVPAPRGQGHPAMDLPRAGATAEWCRARWRPPSEAGGGTVQSCI